MQRIGLIGFIQMLTSLSGIILLPILTKNLSIEDYGMWAQISVTIDMVPGLVMLGLPYTMVRFLPTIEKKEEIQETFYSIFFIVLFTSGLASLVLYFFSSQIASKLFDNNIIIVKILSLIVFVECLNNLLLNYLRAKEQIKKYSLIIFYSTTSQLLIISFFVLMGKGILGATIGMLIKTVILFSVTTFKVIPEIGIKKPLFKNINEYLKFG
ncbi:MAG: lipopolysaccharide biosynthesis protein, partial [Methanosarcina sp.]